MRADLYFLLKGQEWKQWGWDGSRNPGETDAGLDRGGHPGEGDAWSGAEPTGAADGRRKRGVKDECRFSGQGTGADDCAINWTREEDGGEMVGTGEGRNQKLKTGMFCLRRDQKKFILFK